MGLNIKDLKAGEIYAAGEQFDYIFKVKEDGDDHWDCRVSNRSVWVSIGFEMNNKCSVISARCNREVREATKEEKEYLEACIKAGKHLPIPEKQTILTDSYSIY